MTPFVRQFDIFLTDITFKNHRSFREILLNNCLRWFHIDLSIDCPTVATYCYVDWIKLVMYQRFENSVILTSNRVGTSNLAQPQCNLWNTLCHKSLVLLFPRATSLRPSRFLLTDRQTTSTPLCSHPLKWNVHTKYALFRHNTLRYGAIKSNN